ncbi:MAG: NAD(P)H-dependent oxidoreductase [Sphingobacteriaceae bacterium]|nr:NAD(P)H-dependent oxidoreductase [Sphingobacteriaceae bacterium]
MNPILIISCTSRPKSNTLKVSKIYAEIASKQGHEAKILDLNTLPEDWMRYILTETRHPKFDEIIKSYLLDVSAFIFVVPEYNGSFPGVLKLFIDHLPTHVWKDKKACLVGVSVGRAGNLRGLDHLNGILNYLKMNVFHNKLPISKLDQVINNEGVLVDAVQEKVCADQIAGFIQFCNV